MEGAYEAVHESPVFKSIEAARISDTTPIAPGQVKKTIFESDEPEFRKWFEENIGPWPF